jgi:gliding motility-associated protein GldE
LTIVDIHINIIPIGIHVVAELIILLGLLICTALISAGEVAFFSLKPAQIKKLEESKTKNATRVLHCLQNPERLLAVILIAVNLINITIVILSSYITASIFDFSSAPLFGFIFQVVVVTLLILLIGEIIPKVFASENSVKVACMTAYPFQIMSVMFYPLASILLVSTSYVQKKISISRPNLSVDDLSDALEITSDSIKDEKTILEGIVKFGNTEVKEIMKPRLDVVALDMSVSYTKLLSVIVESGYSRIPVYKDSIDNIKGIMITKDILPYLHEENMFNWQALIKPAFFVPETKKIDDLLAEFQKNKMHIAIVIDEYGGTCGLVTMEDILEEVIGEIEDESDVAEELPYKQLAANVWLFEAKVLLNDFFKITGIDELSFDGLKGEYETLAGLILEIKGEIPEKGSKIDYKNFTFVVEVVDKRRIKQVKIIVR